MSKFKRGKAFHLVKKSPSRDEPLKVQVPGGLAMIADRVFANTEGTWMEINKQTLDLLNITLEPPLFVCLMLGENVLFNKIYGKWRVCGKTVILLFANALWKDDRVRQTRECKTVERRCSSLSPRRCERLSNTRC